MYWNIIDENRYKLLENITNTISMKNYYMIGGTSLSLQLGLRESYDFNFCVTEEFNNELLLEELQKLGQTSVRQNQKGTLDVILNGVQVSFFYYPNSVIKEFVNPKEMPKLKLASILDIAVMKVVAIGGRGAKKDFFDLYNILNKSNITIDELAKGLLQKYGNNINFANIIMGLSYFEDAEQEILSKTFVEYNWEEIKKFFINFQTNFYKQLELLES